MIQKELRKHIEPNYATKLQRFFKTGKGEYAEGDLLLGIRTPNIRKVAKQHHNLPMHEIHTLMHSKFHEERFLALVLLVNQFKAGTPKTQESIFNYYLDNTQYINNWDLVDISAHHIVGAFLADKDKSPIYKLAKSQDLWERRIAMIATFHNIKANDHSIAIDIATLLLNDNHDLIHKAVGWMIREIEKRDPSPAHTFLEKYHKHMPRTTLRYAIERLPKEQRNYYMS